MSFQKTLTGKLQTERTPLSALSPNERRIWNYLRTLGEGRTEKQIHSKFLDIGTVGNRLRGLRSKGWTRSWKPYPDRDQLWYALKEERGGGPEKSPKPSTGRAMQSPFKPQPLPAQETQPHTQEAS